MSQLVIHRDPKILGGAPVFRGTRVPIEATFQVSHVSWRWKR